MNRVPFAPAVPLMLLGCCPNGVDDDNAALEAERLHHRQRRRRSLS